MISKKNTFYRFFEKDMLRLDENYNNPIYDELKTIINTSKFEIISLKNTKILKFITSGTTPKNLKQSDELDVPFIGSTAIHDEQIDLINAPRISFKDHETKLKNSQLKKNDLLITKLTIGPKVAPKSSLALKSMSKFPGESSSQTTYTLAPAATVR